MIYLRLLLTLALPLCLGLGTVALVYRQAVLSFLERVALAWGIGLGLLGMGMFLLSLVGIRLTLYSVGLPACSVTLILAGLVIVRKDPLLDANSAIKTLKSLVGLFAQPNRLTAAAEKLLACLILLVIGFACFDALVKPIVNFDDLWRQGCIARVIYSTGRVLTEQNMDLAAGHPFLNPLAQAWIYLGIGEWNDALGKVIFALCFICLILVFYAGIRRYTSRFPALFFTYLLTSFPLIVYHAGTAYSDLMQTFYYTAGIIFLFHWLSAEDRPALMVSSLFLGLGVFIKQLGTPLWGIAAAVLFMSIIFENKRHFRPFVRFLLVSSLIALPWLINRQSFIANYIFHVGKMTGAPAAAALQAPYGPPTLAGILAQMGRRMFFYADWQLLWFVLPASLILCWQRVWRSRLKYLVLIITLDLLMMVYGFTEQNAYTFLVDGTLVQRMMMYQVPVALFLTALCLKEKFLWPM